jgi:hypothetical protein
MRLTDSGLPVWQDKPIAWCGSSYADLCAFTSDAWLTFSSGYSSTAKLQTIGSRCRPSVPESSKFASELAKRWYRELTARRKEG